MKRNPASATDGATRMRLLTLPQVVEMTALSRSSIYALMDQGLFPRPVKIGSRAVRWIEQEVLEFIATRPRTGGPRPRE